VLFLPDKLEPNHEYAVLGYFRVYNYSNKNAAVNLLGIVTGVCLALVVWSVAKLLSKNAALSDNEGQNDAGNNRRKTVDCRVIEK
jgi:hypothetical protein